MLDSVELDGKTLIFCLTHQTILLCILGLTSSLYPSNVCLQALAGTWEGLTGVKRLESRWWMRSVLVEDRMCSSPFFAVDSRSFLYTRKCCLKCLSAQIISFVGRFLVGAEDQQWRDINSFWRTASSQGLGIEKKFGHINDILMPCISPKPFFPCVFVMPGFSQAVCVALPGSEHLPCRYESGWQRPRWGTKAGGWACGQGRPSLASRARGRCSGTDERRAGGDNRRGHPGRSEDAGERISAVFHILC